MNPVLQYSNEEDAKILATVCNPVTEDEMSIEDFELYKSNMFAICNTQGWVWLAANQIGITKRFFLIATSNMIDLCINPKIVDYSGIKTSSEWCLSFADWRKTTSRRYEKVLVEYTNIQWETISTWLKWLEAIVVQHELDHLNWLTV